MSFIVYIIFFICHLWLNLGKDLVKGAAQVRGHSLKLHFCMFEKSQENHNNLDCHEKIWIIFH
jgi:hypothetical protein